MPNYLSAMTTEGDLNLILTTIDEDKTKIRAELKKNKGLGDIGVDVHFAAAHHAWPSITPFQDPSSANVAIAVGVVSDVKQL